MNDVHMHIKQSTIKSTKNSLIDDLAKDLWEAAIESTCVVCDSKKSTF